MIFRAVSDDLVVPDVAGPVVHHHQHVQNTNRNVVLGEFAQVFANVFWVVKDKRVRASTVMVAISDHIHRP